MQTGDSIVADLVRRFGEIASAPPHFPPSLPPRRPSDNGDGMEPRIARLEVDVATIRERLNHLPTKLEVRDTIDGSLEKTAARLQRNIAIGGAVLTLAIGLASNWDKIF